jgi:hypothetical protein
MTISTMICFGFAGANLAMMFNKEIHWFVRIVCGFAFGISLAQALSGIIK